MSPIIDRQRRLREAGRIRIGEKVPTSNGKSRPAKIDVFRFTSADEESIRAVAAVYGGEVHKWTDGPMEDQWELKSEAKVLEVLVPPVDLAFSQWYEEWSAGGCLHRCDGQTDIHGNNPVPCVCDPGQRTCKPTSRLAVIIAAVDGIGTWRLETKGYNAADELEGSIEVLRVIQSKGKMVQARLLLEQRSKVKDGQTLKFAVPVLDLRVPMAALMTGTNDTARLASGVTPIQDTTVTPSIAEQVHLAETPVTAPPRANSAPQIPSTGVVPRSGMVADDPPAQPIQPAANVPDVGEPLLTEPQGKMIGRLFGKLKITDRDERLTILADLFKHPFASSKELTKREATTLITELKVLAGEEETPRQNSAGAAEEPEPQEPVYDESDEERPF